MVDKRNAEVYTEVLTIVDNMNPQYKQRLPKKLIEFFDENSDKEYKFNLNYSVPLKDNKLKPGTKSLLAVLNLQYWCESEEEKKKFLNIYAENESRFQEKFKIENMFVQAEKEKNDLRIFQEENQKKDNNQIMQLIKEENKWYKKIFDKIKNLLFMVFKKNNYNN